METGTALAAAEPTLRASSRDFVGVVVDRPEEGCVDGCPVGFVGLSVGCRVGWPVGCLVGCPVGFA